MKILDIGVVIPTHFRRNWNGMLGRAVNSAAVQTHLPTAIHVFLDDRHRGAPFARHNALMLNRCEWTAFLDSDDWFMPNHLEVLAKAQVETGADYVYSWYELVRLGQRMGTKDLVFPPGHFENDWDPAEPRQTTITTLVRTELAQSIGFWAPEDEQTFEDGHRVGEDYHFTLECNRLGKIHHVKQRTWFWDHHGANTSGRGGQGDAV